MASLAFASSGQHVRENTLVRSVKLAAAVTSQAVWKDTQKCVEDCFQKIL